MEKKKFLIEFRKALEDMYKTVSWKSHDYSWSKDVFGNFKLSEKLGICKTEKWILVRLLDKVSRISNLINKNPEIKNEKVGDTLKDLACYSIILFTYLNKDE